ncbi:hypothetical protein F2P81_008744 [Scophthalmus maximus]|uniref:N-acetyltransferase domain-containing protein n=1 Tax=Scophthalmus maximus TaxID=52904 RepID=A0A6A4T2J9_SCOMX|nr:hypothetical protein F2P81_008744 [Scophthalmus maximus]
MWVAPAAAAVACGWLLRQLQPHVGGSCGSCSRMWVAPAAAAAACGWLLRQLQPHVGGSCGSCSRMWVAPAAAAAACGWLLRQLQPHVGGSCGSCSRMWVAAAAAAAACRWLLRQLQPQEPPAAGATDMRQLQQHSWRVTVSARIPSLDASLQKYPRSINPKKYPPRDDKSTASGVVPLLLLTAESGGFTVVGYALYFHTYSTWKGRSLYLEDLYVMEEFRGIGIGKGLMGKVAEVAKKKQCVRLQLSVLNWNTSTRDFYAAKGAQDLTEREGWHLIRFDGENLDNLANDAPSD